MPDLEGEPGTFWQVLERVAEGGLLRLVVGKPVQQALGRFIFGFTDVPVAYFEQWAQAVRSETAAKKLVVSGVASAARSAAIKNPDLAQRGVERWTRGIQSRQEAREDIAARTLLALSEADLPSEAMAPSEDFMRMFEDVAERASSDDLRDLMARILAGEIRKPSSISRRTLQVAAVLDHNIVKALHEAHAWRLDGDWIHVTSREFGAVFDLLSTVSITTDASPRTMRFDDEQQAYVKIGAKVIRLTSEKGMTSFIDGANFTSVGLELISALPMLIEDKSLAIAQGFKALSFIHKVEIGNYIDEETFANFKDV